MRNNRRKYGWHYGFGIAGIGMLLGLFVFMRNKHKLDYREHVQGDTIVEKHHPLGEPPHPKKLSKSIVWKLNLEHIVYVLSFISIALFALLVKNYELMTYVLTPFALIVFAILLIMAFRGDKVERERMFVVLILLLFTTLFWAFFEQAGSSLTLFANENVNRNLWGEVVPASLFQSVNPFFIIVLASPFTYMWLWLGARKKEPSTPQKFALGIFLLSLGFLLLAIAPMWLSQNKLLVEQGGGAVLLFVATVPMVLLVLSYLLQTLGELCLSPIGLSMVTKLVSPKIVGMVLGAWFLSSAMAHHIAGIIANATTEQESTVEVMLESFKTDIPESCFVVSKEKFIEKSEATLQEGFVKANALLLEQTSIAEKPEIKKDIIVSSTLEIYKKNLVVSEIKDTVTFKACVTHSIEKGIQHMKHVGDVGVEHAISKGYISKQQADSFTYSTRNSVANLLNYTNVFYVVGIIALLASLVLFALSPMIKRMMHGV